ncbi:Lnb N-terminal periplasmic domain-containing protein [Micavibrio aeruginosavorus]|uniref:Lnb N-terminal periplasmic domain-containing protein n=1 Tax=Micavibrio aeruginosavorus TaxID=349221 RepID=UPI003F4AC5F0
MQPSRKSKIIAVLRALGLSLVILIPSIFVGLALWYRAPGQGLFGLGDGSWLAAGLWAAYVVATLYYALFTWRRPLATGAFMLAMALAVMWWTAIKPQNYRYWMPEVANILAADIDGNMVTIKDVRNFTWRSLDDYDAKWDQRTYDIDTITSVDLFLSYWGMPAIAHTLVSFGFANGDHLVFSVEIRKEEGEVYSNLAGFFKEYELALIAADERDIIYLRTNVRGEDVYRYSIKAKPESMKALFLSYLNTGNTLRKAPQFYNTLTANCTTIVFSMAQAIVPGLHMDPRVILSGYLPEYMHERGGLNAPEGATLTDIKSAAAITAKARKINGADGYSRRIRAE